jgi:hypothetical protein
VRTTPHLPREYPAPTRRMRILVLDEGDTMNCELFRKVPEHDIDRLDCGPQASAGGTFRSCWKAVTNRIRRKEYDLAVVTDRKYCFWRPDVGMLSGFMRLAGASLWKPRRLAHLLVPRELTQAGIPWALMERNDQCLIRDGNHLLFHLATRVFVRELLQNRYEIFQAYREGSERMRLWPKAFRCGPQVPLDLGKILPISLGWRSGEIHAEPSLEKIHDIIFCGQTSMRTPRMAAVSELKESARREGWRFFCPERLTQEEFHRECARAWLCLSPSGNGWDCYRHYEALLTGSVPLINYPWIERYAPMEDGKHCFFFSVERGHLTEVVHKALGEKERLKSMARAGEELTRKYHSGNALRNYVIQETLQAVATKN